MTDIPATACRIAVLGFGTVGSATVRRLAGPNHAANLELTHIFDRRVQAKRPTLDHCSRYDNVQDRFANIVWTECIDDVLTSDVDVIVEAIGGPGTTEVACEWIRRALQAGKSVVTANKQVIARDISHGGSLLTLAARQGRQLRFEAAVGGAMPIIRSVGEGLAGDRLTRIAAILNGTANSVLSRMEQTGCTLEDALDEARARGYAEADPSADLDGVDAAAKLSIVCAVAFGVRIDASRIEIRSVRDVESADFDDVRRKGGTIRQLACAEYDRATATLTAWVAPVVVPQASVFGRTTGPENAAILSGEYAGDIGIFGAGAGGDATAVAILGDLITIARDRAAIVPAPTLTAPRTIKGICQSAAFPVFAGRTLETEYAEAV